MFAGESFWFVAIVALLLLMVCVKFLVPKLMASDNAKVRFGIGTALLVIYTLAGMLLLYFFAMGASGVEDCIIRVIFAFAVLNFIVLLTAVQYFLSRDKRKITEMDKMKLKDL